MELFLWISVFLSVGAGRSEEVSVGEEESCGEQ